MPGKRSSKCPFATRRMTDASQLLVARLSASPPGLDLALTDAEEAAYACTLDRMTAIWPHDWELIPQ